MGPVVSLRFMICCVAEVTLSCTTCAMGQIIILLGSALVHMCLHTSI